MLTAEQSVVLESPRNEWELVDGCREKLHTKHTKYTSNAVNNGGCSHTVKMSGFKIIFSLPTILR